MVRKIGIKDFHVSYTYEIRFHDVIGQSTVPMYPYANFQNMADLHGEMSVLEPFFLNLIRWIQLSDKKNLTFVNR